MKLMTTWNEKMSFTSATVNAETSGLLHLGQIEVGMDAHAPLGDGKFMTPKELVVAGLCGCTAMDVVAFLKKNKQIPDQFQVHAAVDSNETGYPKVFERIALEFRLKGKLEPAYVIEAVQSSQTKYCGVSAMLSKAAQISYRIWLNDQQIGEGKAAF